METGIDVGGVDLGHRGLLLAAAVAVVVAMTIFLAILKSFLYICRPNEILIFAGRRHTLPDGSSVGYKVVRHGWALRTPLLETVSRMDMRLIMVEVAVTNAYSSGGIPLDVQAIANVKIASDPAHVRNAVERFLSMTPQQIAVVARQTLEGVLREVLAQLTPEEVNEDRLKFAETLKHNAQDDFDKLGLELDVLKVQHVSDEQQYLQNLGRARIAIMIRDAQNAENEANQKIAEEQAAARQRAESAQKQAEALVLQKRNVLRGELAAAGGAGQVHRERGRDRRRDGARRRRAGAAAAAQRAGEAAPGVRRGAARGGGPAGRGRRARAARRRPSSRTARRPRRRCAWCPRSGRRRGRTAARSTSCSSCAPSWRRRSPG